MLKQFSCLALFGIAISLNAMEPSSINTNASAQELGSYDELSDQQQYWLRTLDGHIERCLAAPSNEKVHAYRAISNWLKQEPADLVSSFLKIPLPSIQLKKTKNGSCSLYDKVQALIEENQQELSKFTTDSIESDVLKLVEQRDCLQEIKRLLEPDAAAQTGTATNAPNADERRRRGPGKSNPRKGGFLAGITRNHVLVTLGVLGASYVVWKKFLTTSDEDKK